MTRKSPKPVRALTEKEVAVKALIDRLVPEIRRIAAQHSYTQKVRCYENWMSQCCETVCVSFRLEDAGRCSREEARFIDTALAAAGFSSRRRFKPIAWDGLDLLSAMFEKALPAFQAINATQAEIDFETLEAVAESEAEAEVA